MDHPEDEARAKNNSGAAATQAAAGGGGGGGGISHSGPLRTLLSPNSGMAMIHGTGIPVASRPPGGAGTAPVHTSTSSAAAASAGGGGGGNRIEQPPFAMPPPPAQNNSVVPHPQQLQGGHVGQQQPYMVSPSQQGTSSQQPPQQQPQNVPIYHHQPLPHQQQQGQLPVQSGSATTNVYQHQQQHVQPTYLGGGGSMVAPGPGLSIRHTASPEGGSGIEVGLVACARLPLPPPPPPGGLHHATNIAAPPPPQPPNMPNNNPRFVAGGGAGTDGGRTAPAAAAPQYSSIPPPPNVAPAPMSAPLPNPSMQSHQQQQAPPPNHYPHHATPGMSTSTATTTTTTTGATRPSSGGTAAAPSMMRAPGLSPPTSGGYEGTMTSAAASSGKVPISGGTTTTTAMTPLDAEADRFLSGPSKLTELGGQPQLYPPPPPPRGTTPALDVIRFHANRRSWQTVLQLLADVLDRNEAQSASPNHRQFYAKLLQRSHPPSSTSTTNGPTSSSATGGGDDDDREELVLQRGDVMPDDGDVDIVKGETVELIALRFRALLALRKYADLGREVELLGLLPPSSSPSDAGVSRTHPKQHDSVPLPPWVPYGLRIMAAQSLQYTDKAQRCFDTLFALKEDLDGIVKTQSSLQPDKSGKNRRWIGRVHAALSNAFMRQGEWRLALSSIDDLAETIPFGAKAEVLSWIVGGGRLEEDEKVPESDDVANVISALVHASMVDIHSRQGRIMLQVGAIPEAHAAFEEAREDVSSLSSHLERAQSVKSDRQPLVDRVRQHVLVKQASTQLVMNDGLLHFAREEYDESAERFTHAIDLQRGGGGAGGSTVRYETPLEPGVGIDTEDSLLSPCLNNLALCALYTCEMHKAVEMIETLVREDPTVFLTEVMAFNLCTLYELGSDNAVSGRKKKTVQLIAKRFGLHDIGTESFRIS